MGTTALPSTVRFYLYDKPSRKYANRIYACCIKDFVFKYANGKIVTDLATVEANTVA